MKIATVLCALALSGGSVAAHAQAYGSGGYGQVPGPHPAYLHALSDLRAARHYLNDGWAWQPVRAEDNKAIREIDAAINDIKTAAIDDGKGLNEAFPIDGHLTPQNRFAKANELLYAAHQDLAKAEDVPQSRGLRDRALRHVDAAHNTGRPGCPHCTLAVAAHHRRRQAANVTRPAFRVATSRCPRAQPVSFLKD